MSTLLFTATPTAYIYDNLENLKEIEETIWGDEIHVEDEKHTITVNNEIVKFVRVTGRNTPGWMRLDQLQETRLLDVMFVDIGQGDGAIVTTPQGQHMVIDAGQEDNMQRFLDWRFNRFMKPTIFEAAIVSHPDEDHYGGFQKIFDNIPNIRFKTMYHNGLVERKVVSGDQLGSRLKDSVSRRTYQSELIENRAQLESLLDQTITVKGKQVSVTHRKNYPSMLKTALTRCDDIRMLDHRDGFLPGYESGDLTIEVLGPVVETVEGQSCLRRFRDHGKTKNGHSIILKLRYKEVTMLLGGDLNVPAEEFLLAHHTGLEPSTDVALQEHFLRAARKIFGVDVAKSCHHGSADFTNLWLEAVHPLATVISSGDNEPHSHPRAETLGAIGRTSRGQRPLIFSTELARSTKDDIREPHKLRKAILSLTREINQIEGNKPEDVKKREALHKKQATLVSRIERSVAVYGMINVRTDGNQILFAQKLERPSGKRKWDIYILERVGGELRYKARHH